jgi:peptidoglycan/xylan/chitin deacetylase (PgdA/CDA1 family)
MVNILKRAFIGLVVAAGIFALGFTFWVRDHYVVPILMYHNVADVRKEGDLNTVSTAEFKKQMRFLKRHRYNVISFDDLIEGLNKGHVFQKDTVVIQFDDGFEDNYTNAFPVLKEYEFPAIVFLVSDLIGVDKSFLTWEQVKEMEKYNFVAGAHTRTHAYLPNLTNDQIREEIAGSKRVIEEKLGHRVDYFAYPSGGFNISAKEIAKEAGFKAAVTTNRGKDRLNRDFFELKRIRMNEDDSSQFKGIVMWAKLSGYYNLFRKSKSGH